MLQPKKVGHRPRAEGGQRTSRGAQGASGSRASWQGSPWQETRLERAFSSLFENGKIVGLIGTYVDDLFATGDPNRKL